MFTLRAATLVPFLALALAGCPSKEPCPSGQIECHGACVDPQIDPTGCGAGCALCPSGGTCAAGVCQCPTGQTDCGGACVDLQTDALHCGSCLQFCGLGSCSGGVCACDGGATACTGPGAQCVNLSNDTSNCNACRQSCGGYERCISGVCTCVAPNLVCGTQCVPAATDASNCGACGKVCATGATCASGTCSCPTNAKVCGAAPGACVAVASDPANCGDCGIACPTGAKCSAGSCACPVLPAAVCGAGAGNCCKGTGCCGNGCQTEHSNGLGGSYFNCLAIGPASALAYSDARAAADAWSAGTDVNMGLTACPTACYGRVSSVSGKCAIWCYGGSSFPGHVNLDTQCICPTDLNPAWN